MTMEIYRYNCNCVCMRCRYRGSVWGVVLVTLGIQLLLDTLDIRDMDFGRTLPVLLIVIGVMLVLQRTASVEGHVQPLVGSRAVPLPPPVTSTGMQTSSSASAIEVRHE